MYANCLIIALLHKIRHPTNKLYAIKPSNNPHGHFHIIWIDKDNRSFHFTRNKNYNVKCEWWFKGHIEELHLGQLKK